MDENSKFNDFFDDNTSTDVTDVSFVSVPEGLPKYSAEPSKAGSTEEEVYDAVDSLIKKYGLSVKNMEVKEVLSRVEDISDLDNATFDLVSSKLIKDYVSRVALKGVIVQASMLNKVFDLMDKTKFENIDADSLLVIEKAFNYEQKLFDILDRYDKPGVEESLKHMAKLESDSKDSEAPKLSPADIKKLIEQIQNEGKENKESGGENEQF